MAENIATISVRLTQEDKEKLQEIASKEDRSLSQVVRRIVREYLMK